MLNELNHFAALTLSNPNTPFNIEQSQYLVHLFLDMHEHGAYIADVIISLVETCRMNGQNPEDYLTMLMKNKSSVFAHPEQWLPWNYKDTEGMNESAFRPPVGSQPGSQRLQDFRSTTECAAC